MRNNYRCVLSTKNGFMEEILFLKGECADDIIEFLEMFSWPAGSWSVKQHDED